MLHTFMSQFSVEVFVSQYRKTLQGNPYVLCFRKFPVAKKFFDKRGGEYQVFASKYSCLTVTKNAVGEHFSLSLFSGIEKVWVRGWGGGAECQNFPSKISCLTVPEFSVRQTFRVSINYGLENFYDSEGYVTIFCRNFFVSHGQKYS